MAWQSSLLKGLFRFGLAVVTAVAAVADVAAQALLVERLPGGSQLVLVSQPLADATSLAWPAPDVDGELQTAHLVAGRLTLVADVEAAFAGPGEADVKPLAPAVIVAVGGASAGELADLLARVLRDRPPMPAPRAATPSMVEGGLDRRLGAPGSDALVRLEVPLPPPGDPRRSAVEVLWDLVPQLLVDVGPLLATRIDGELGVLEARVDPELAELTVRSIRFSLLRFASDPALQADAVAAARRRLAVRRQAMLEEHPQGAGQVLAQWQRGGEDAVREFLFGIDAVTVDSVRDAVSSWLAHHPGRAQLVLPPSVFNPRFAGGPQTLRLANDISAAVLERSGAPLAVVCLRPVMVPDLDGSLTATVLTRLARELRVGSDRPGWVRVRRSPPLLEVAGPADDFGELLERLSSAHATVAEDQTPTTGEVDDAHRRALDLMASRLGITETGDPSPANFLRPGNLALGVVAGDAEATMEALQKFWAVASGPDRAAVVNSMVAAQRTRVAAPGDESVLVAALELPFGGDEAVSLVVRELLAERARRLWPDTRVAVLAPFVPGRSLLVLEVTVRGAIDALERRVEKGWSAMTSAVSETELTPIKRRVAATSSAEMSGVAGHARRCAATAAGASAWHQPAEFELEILTLDPERISAALKGVADWSQLDTTGAGVLPIEEPRRR